MRWGSSALLALILIGGDARADAPRHVEAQKHFELGRRARASGDLVTAISEFNASLAQERSVGALFNLGGVYEQQGHYRAALEAYEKARTFALSLGDPRASEALDAERAIRATRSWVTIVVRPEVAALADLRVVVDAEPVPGAELNAEVFRDRTQHVVVVSARGRQSATVSAADHGSVDVTSELLPALTPVAAAPEKPETTAPPSDWKKWTAVGLGTGGVAALGLGVVATVAYAGTRSDIRTDQTRVSTACATGHCPSDAAARNASNQQRYADNNHRAAIEQSVAYGLGGVMFASAVYLFVTRGSTPEPSVEAAPMAGPRLAGFTVRTIF